MKKIEIALWELTKEEAALKSEDEQILIYNPLIDEYKIEHGGKRSLANNKHAYSGLKYFSFNERD